MKINRQPMLYRHIEIHNNINNNTMVNIHTNTNYVVQKSLGKIMTNNIYTHI